MGAVVDTIHVEPKELAIITNRYPECRLLHEPASDITIDRYRVIIPNETEDNYYTFLLDNCLAMSSFSFVARVESDPRFAKKMRQRMVDNSETRGDSAG